MTLDLSTVTVPQWFTSAIGLVVIALVWRAVGVAADEAIRRTFPRRRVGNRSSDDTLLATGERGAWMDRLIDAMTANAEVNKEVAATLSMMVTKQDAILDAFKEHQQVQRETNTKVDSVLGRLRLRPEGA